MQRCQSFKQRGKLGMGERLTASQSNLPFDATNTVTSDTLASKKSAKLFKDG